MKKTQWSYLPLLLIPAALSASSFLFQSVIPFAVSALSILVLIRLIPGLSVHANLWAFLMLTPIAAVLNFCIDDLVAALLFLEDTCYTVLIFSRLAMIHAVLFPLEQMFFGILVRLFYPRQYTLRMKDNNAQRVDPGGSTL